MKILITGGTGFIGRNLVEKLKDDYQISSPSVKEVDLLSDSDVENYIKSNKFDAVIHAATWNATRNSNKDLTKVFYNNLRMFFNLAKCHSHFGKMLYFGSGAEFDRDNWNAKMSEDYFGQHVPGDEYGFSKFIMNKYAKRSKNIYNLRLFGVFGKYEDWEIRFISNACCKAAWDLPITIKQNVYFDYLYIDDLIKITKWFIDNDVPEKTYNICTGQAIDLCTYAQKVLQVAGKQLDIKVAKESLGAEYSGSNEKLLNLIGDFNFTTADDAIKELYGWYHDNKNNINAELLIKDK